MAVNAAGLARMVRQVRATGAQVLVLGPTPKPRVDVPDCLAEHLREATACTTPRAVAVNTAGMAAERRAVLAAGGAYLDVTPWLCTRSTCAVEVGNLLAYRDDNHLTTTYTAWLSPLLGDQLDQTLRRPIARPTPPPHPGRNLEHSQRPSSSLGLATAWTGFGGDK